MCLTGGDREDHEDEEADHERGAADRTRRDPQEHVPAVEEDHQGADRVAHRASVHEARRGQHQHVHVPRIAAPPASLLRAGCVVLGIARLALQSPGASRVVPGVAALVPQSE